MVRDHCYPKCGDGVRVPFEGCDDGNTQDLSLRIALGSCGRSCFLHGPHWDQDGDGCSSACRIELGYACHGGNTTSTDICRLTVCGDGVVEAGCFMSFRYAVNGTCEH